MFNLPVCPHCGAKYYYKDTLKAKKEKEICCHHCKKNFEVKKLSGYIVLFTFIFIFAVLTNVFILCFIKTNSIISLIIVSVLYIIIGILLMPYFIKFKKTDKKER